MSRIARNGQWIGAPIGGETALMSVEAGNYVVLSRVGSRIWELIEQPTTAEQICAQLVTEFDVTDEVCRREVDSFIDALEQARAIVRSPS